MKGFIKLTFCDDGAPILVPITTILAVTLGYKEKGVTYVETYFDYKNGSSGIYVRETFDEVVEKIKNAI